jgi:hypothetical protein
MVVSIDVLYFLSFHPLQPILIDVSLFVVSLTFDANNIDASCKALFAGSLCAIFNFIILFGFKSVSFSGDFVPL